MEEHCWQRGRDVARTHPDFCPTDYRASAPRAYYQKLVATIPHSLPGTAIRTPQNVITRE